MNKKRNRDVCRKLVYRKTLMIFLVAALLIGIFQPAIPVKNRKWNTNVFAAAQSGHGLSNPVTDSDGVATWDCVYFGNYWQNDTNGDGTADKNDEKEPIKWRVLSVEGDDAFLLADQNLDAQVYNWSSAYQLTWETCIMRSWLNGYGEDKNVDDMDYTNNSFLGNAFSPSEQSAIKTTHVINANNPEYDTSGGNDTDDKVYLPSIDEVTNPDYGFSSSKDYDKKRWSMNTAYAAGGGELQSNNIVEKREGYPAYWWLRSTGKVHGLAVLVVIDGAVWMDGRNVDIAQVNVRPALHLDLSHTDIWQHAGKVDSEGEITGQEELTGTVTYDAAEFASFQGRTKEEVGRRYGEAMYAGESYMDGDSSTYYEKACLLEKSYFAGSLTADTHKTMTAMTEFYRWLVGVKPLQAVSEHSDKLQAEALVRNFEFNHTVSDSSKPKDMTQGLWDYGAKNYRHTILARYSTPRNSITSWMNEGYSLSLGWDTVGHRYALIGAEVSDLQFGYAGNIAVGQEKACKNVMENPFSAYPAPGAMPNDLVHSSSSAWSIQINQNVLNIKDRNSVVVKVTDMDTAESYDCTVANGKLQASEDSSLLVFVQPVPVSGKRYEGSYRVDVTGLIDAASGKEGTITYTTDFFEPTEYMPSYVKGETTQSTPEPSTVPDSGENSGSQTGNGNGATVGNTGTSIGENTGTGTGAGGADSTGENAGGDGTGSVTGDGTAGNETTDSGTEKPDMKEEESKATVIPKVAEVKKFKVKAQRKGLVLTWEKDAKISGHQLQVSTNKNFKNAKKISVKKSKNKYKATKLKPRKKYYVRIRAYQYYKTQNGKKKMSYGKWTVKRIKTLK
ncbi:MAG: DUF6273 domain-containing protein [Roseburia sp.]|nr:DUF6273 domain-containing protein [Roseburia sp.]